MPGPLDGSFPDLYYERMSNDITIEHETADFDKWGTVGGPALVVRIDGQTIGTVDIVAVDGPDRRGRTTYTQMLDGDCRWVAIADDGPHHSGTGVSVAGVMMMFH